MALDSTPRDPHGEPLLVWGEDDQDALRVRSPGELAIALDGLHAIAAVVPVLARLWSAGDDQVACALDGDHGALFVVRGARRGSSIGDASRTGTFELEHHELGVVRLPWRQCVPWPRARVGLLQFAHSGELGLEVELEASIPSQLVVLRDLHRAAELAMRGTPPSDPAQSSLAYRTPHGDWARRLLAGLHDLQLAELDLSIRDAIAARTAILLIQHGEHAQDSLEAADRLARELTKIRGVGALFATPGDLQIALRRTQDAPTRPVELPFT
jgi:hypothetical protein